MPILIIVLALICQMAAYGQARVPPIESTTTLQGAKCPDEVAWYGYYQNIQFGFYIAIPNGMAAFWNSAHCGYDEELDECVCMGDHGRIIPLDETGAIEVFAVFNDEPLGSPKEVLSNEIRYLRESKKITSVKAESSNTVNVKGLPGVHYKIGYWSRGQEWVHEEVSFHDHNENISYFVSLVSIASCYENNHCEWQWVLENMHLTTFDPCFYEPNE